jgi:gluconokinase
MLSDTGAVDPADACAPLVLSIDAGTSSVRALVYDALGRQVTGRGFHRPYAVSTTPDGGVTADPELLLELTVACIDDVVAQVAEAGRSLAAVACDTFWHSLVAVDATGRPVTPVLTWADTRSGSAVPELRRRLDQSAIHARTGCVFHSSYWPAKLLWLQQTQPDVVERAAYWMSFAEYLYLHLFGMRRVSLSMASGTGLFDQNACAWDQEVLAALPIREDQLSPLADLTDAMTGLDRPFAGRWPALANLPWYLPIGDGAASNIGTGGYQEDIAVVMVGTSGALRVVREVKRVRIPPGLWTYRVDRRRFVEGGALSSGGNVFAWLARTLSIADIFALEGQISRRPPDGHGLTVLPFLAGERSPDWNAQARAAFIGASLNTTPTDIIQASLEAIAYRFGLVYRILKDSVPTVGSIIGSGAGLIHSPLWMQIMTDVLNEAITASAVPEATSRGAALLALEALGVIAHLSEAPAPLGARFEPRTDRTEIYRAAIDRQERLYHALTRLGSEKGMA